MIRRSSVDQMMEGHVRVELSAQIQRGVTSVAVNLVSEETDVLVTVKLSQNSVPIVLCAYVLANVSNWM